jgi:hypothetical protein
MEMINMKSIYIKLLETLMDKGVLSEELFEKFPLTNLDPRASLGLCGVMGLNCTSTKKEISKLKLSVLKPYLVTAYYTLFSMSFDEKTGKHIPILSVALDHPVDWTLEDMRAVLSQKKSGIVKELMSLLPALSDDSILLQVDLEAITKMYGRIK